MNDINAASLSIFQEGRGKSIIVRVNDKVSGIQESFKQYGFELIDLPPAVQFSIKELKSLTKRVEANSTEMDRSLEREEIINKKAGVRKIQEIQHLIKKRMISSSSGAARELQILKMKHAEDLNTLVSYRHQALVKRLKIVRDWERILNRELEIHESLKNTLVTKLIGTVNEAGDEDLINHVRKKLSTMSISNEMIDCIKDPKKDTQVANIDAIRTMVMDDLSTVSRMETHIEEKKQLLSRLAQLIEEIKRPLPDSAVQEAEQEEELVVEEANEEAKKEKSGGMFSSFRRKS